jgi:tryptophan 2,3-dioxygenase
MRTEETMPPKLTPIDEIKRVAAGNGSTDYEKYLNTFVLFGAQKRETELVNHDELQFQVVHQIQELWMKLMVHELLEAMERLKKKHYHSAFNCFERAHRVMRSMSDEIGLLETMSPKDYQAIRTGLGNGSGQESPGFRALLLLAPHLWHSFEQLLKERSQTIESIYSDRYSHDSLYVLAEHLIEFDENFQKFRMNHFKLIARTIGFSSKSLKGRSVEMLIKGIQHSFFPELWEIRCRMTEVWGNTYGQTRKKLG